MAIAVLDCLCPDHREMNVRQKRTTHGMSGERNESVEDPYLLSERFVGDAPEYIIPWSTIDRRVFPSPWLGGDVLCDMLIDDPRRLRSLCVEQLRREPNQTFRPADIILKELNARMARMPEWNRYNFKIGRAS